MTMRSQYRLTRSALKAPSLSLIYEDENDNNLSKISQYSSVKSTKCNASKPKACNRRNTSGSASEQGRRVLGEISTNTNAQVNKIGVRKSSKENVRPCAIAKTRATESNYNLRTRSTAGPRKALAELSNNAVVMSVTKKPPVPPKKLDKGTTYVNDKPRRKQTANKISISQRRDEPKRSSSTVPLVRPAPNFSVTEKLNNLQLTQQKDTKSLVKGFSNYRFGEAASLSTSLPLPYAPEFLRIPEYLEDIHKYLLLQENHHFRGVDFLLNSSISPRWRAILVDWMVSVGLQFSMSDETVHTAVLLLDSLLKANNSVTRRVFQLIGVTCLFIASKFEEKFPRRVQDYTDSADGEYSIDDILNMEEFILKNVKFQIPPASSLMFYRRGFKVITFQHPGVYMYRDLFFTGSFTLELAMVEYEACAILPSKLGAGCLSLSMMINRMDLPVVHMWNENIQRYLHWTIRELKPVLITLCDIVQRSYTDPEQLTNVMKKFAGPNYYCVSTVAHLNPERWHESVRQQINSV